MNFGTRKLKNDTVVKVYRFGLMPHGKLPPEFWSTCKQMQNLQNELVEMRNKLTENFLRLNLIGDDRKDERVKYWSEFDKIRRRHIKDYSDRLGYGEREYVEKNFDRADRKARKEKTGLSVKKGLNRISILHRFGDGGMMLEKFKRTKSTRFTMDFSTGRGVFTVLKDKIPVFEIGFQANLHREIPEDAAVKSVTFVGKRLKYSGFNKKHLPEEQRDWTWSLNITVEMPAPEKRKFLRGRIASAVFGWEKYRRTDYLRVASVLDSDGNFFDVRLPLRHLSNSARHGKLAAGLEEIIELDSIKSELVEKTKKQLTQLGHKGLTKFRERSLFRMREGMKGDEPSRAILDKFAEQFLPAASRRVRSSDRLSKYRDWLYQNVAAFLAENYDALVWESDLTVKKMVEQKSELTYDGLHKNTAANLRRENSAKYRNFANLSGLRGYVKKAFDKKGKTIFGGASASINRKCSACGELIEQIPAKYFVCPNGHKFLKNFNAAANLLDQLRDECEVAEGGKIAVPDQPHRDLSAVIKPGRRV